jgi:Ca2+-binding RTX toxin-like protein
MPIATELNIAQTNDASLVAETVFGPGITIVSSTLTGTLGQIGIYSDGLTTSPNVAPSDSGVIFSTGNVADFTNSSGTTDTNTQQGTTTAYGGAGDTDLTAMSGVETFDAVVFEAVFIPDNDFLTMQFVFSSEEYLEFVNGGFNDVIAVMVNGTVVELTPTGDTVSVDTVNTVANSNLYIDNPAATDPYNSEMDGLTITMAFKAPVNIGVENTIKIGVADGGDDALDSNFLIAANSLQTVAIAFADEIELLPNSPGIIDVLANDTDFSGQGLTVTKINDVDVVAGDTVSFGTGEAITLNSDGTLSVVTDGDLTASTFTYEVTDGNGITDVGYVTVTTAAVPDPDGYVDGTTDADLIDVNYTGDPQGDRVDNNDSLGVQGTSGDGDVINGFEGNDTILAGDGDDIVDGGSGADVIDGGAGNDTINGGAGNDTINGGVGNDALTGGDGDDTFTYAPGDGIDTISDFNVGITGTLTDGDRENNDFVDLSAYYDNIWELTSDYRDDGVLNQSNDGLAGADYADNTQFGNGGLVFTNGVASTSFFNVENTGVVCFAAGTRILTVNGDCPVESLRAGDQIVTRDNGVQTLCWIGHRHLNASDLGHAPKLRPILLSPELTGADAPLIVSPQHGVLLDLDGEETLIRAIHLAKMKGGAARIMKGCRKVTYFHLMFEDHQIVFANGAPSESFFPGNFALASLQTKVRHEIFELFPDLRRLDANTGYGAKARNFARFSHLPSHLKALKAHRKKRMVPSAAMPIRGSSVGSAFTPSRAAL